MTAVNYGGSGTTTQWLWFLNSLGTVRMSHAEGRDGISIVEFRVPHGDSPPLHIHRTEDEAFYVLNGVLHVRVGDSDVRIGAGGTALVQTGVPHTYVVESPEGACFLAILTHGDFERFVRAMSRPATRPELPTPQGPPSPAQAEALAQAAREHGIEFVGPPLEPEDHPASIG